MTNYAQFGKSKLYSPVWIIKTIIPKITITAISWCCYFYNNLRTVHRDKFIPTTAIFWSNGKSTTESLGILDVHPKKQWSSSRPFREFCVRKDCHLLIYFHTWSRPRSISVENHISFSQSKFSIWSWKRIKHIIISKSTLKIISIMSK